LFAENISTEIMTLSAPSLRRLYGDWKVRRHCRIPRRADFDPAAMSYILGSLSLIEVWRDPLRFRARVHGTNLAQHLGFEFTGKFVDEVEPTKYFRLIVAHFTDVVENERPSFSWLLNEIEHPPIWESEALVLPLSREGDRVDFLLSAVAHRRKIPLTEISHPYNRIAALPA
jgi:hypothetical protein